MYFQDFPEEVRPRTLITRDRDEIKAFAKDEKGPIVLKPLPGPAGRTSSWCAGGPLQPEPDDRRHRARRLRRRAGVPARRRAGDMRLFMMNAEPLVHKGKYAAFRRVRVRRRHAQQLTAGGKLARAEITDEALKMAEIIRPKLVMDGMFLVGLDIVGDKLMEVNVFSPGGLGSAQKLEKVDFSRAVIEALERKAQYHAHYRRGSDNPVLATL
jgi:glutathione synthase